MKLKSFNCIVGLLIIFLYSPLLGEEKIDIWKNKKQINNSTEKSEDKKLTLIPYYSWANREVGEMAVWLDHN